MTLKCNTTHVSWGLETQPALREWLRDGAGWNERELVPRISPACSLRVWFLQNGLPSVSWCPFQPPRPSSIVVSSLLPSQFPPVEINFPFLPITAAVCVSCTSYTIYYSFHIVWLWNDYALTMLIFWSFPDFSYLSICLRYFAKSAPSIFYLLNILFIFTNM